MQRRGLEPALVDGLIGEGLQSCHGRNSDLVTVSKLRIAFVSEESPNKVEKVVLAPAGS